MYHIKSILSSFLVLSFVLSNGAVFAYAQDEPHADVPPGVSDEQLDRIQERRDAVSERMDANRNDAQMHRDTANERMDAKRNDAQLRRDDMRTKAETRHEEARTRFEERRVKALERRDEKKQELSDRRDELRQRWEARKAELSERRKEKIKNHIERIINRMQHAIDRLGALADKIERRIDSLEADGVEVNELHLLLSDARDATSRAQSALDNTTAELRAAPDADNPAEAIGNARLQFEDVKSALREAHAALVEVIVAIKKGQLIEKDDETDVTTTTEDE